MTRPLYEKDTDVWAETLVMGEYLCYVNWKKGLALAAQKIDIRRGEHSPDFRIIDTKIENRVVGYAEVKCRNYTSHQIAKRGGLFLSAHKYAALMKCVEAGYPTVLVAAFKDVWGFYNIGRVPVSHTVGGRQDRGDPEDMESVVVFEPAQLKRFHNVNGMAVA